MQEDEFKLKATILSGERMETETCCQAEAVYIIYILPGRVLRRVNAKAGNEVVLGHTVYVVCR